MTNQQKICIFFVPFFLLSLFLYLKIFNSTAYIKIIQEDALLENLQFVFYGLSSLISIKILTIFIYRKEYLLSLIYFILSLALILISFEELSWGQRIVSIDTPEFFLQNNTHKELNIHNLSLFQNYLHYVYLIVGFFGSISFFLIRFINHSWKKLLNCVVPDWYVSSYFFCTFLIYAFILEYVIISGDLSFFIWRDQEPAEFFLALGFFIFQLATFRVINKNN